MDANVQTLVSQLSNGQADLTEAAQLYNDVVGELSSYPILTNFASVTPISGLVQLPVSARKILYVAYNGSGLGPLSIREANWLFPDWEETLGPPQAYVEESFGSRSFQLVPIDSSQQATIIYSESRQMLPSYLVLPVALLILYHEYLRESDHQNTDLAQACKALADFVLSIIVSQIHE